MSTISLNTSLVSAVTLLGGEGVPGPLLRVVMDWIPLVRRGSASACVDAVACTTRITQRIWPMRWPFPSAPWPGANAKAPCPPKSRPSSRALRPRGRARRNVFEDADSALNWLQSPNASWAASPRCHYSTVTDIGADSVLDTLGRIEHGVFA